jgi:hypothetical protein
MIRPDERTLKALATVANQYPEIVQFLDTWRQHELETLPSVTNNVTLQQGRCQVLGEISKLVNQSPTIAAKT